MGKMKLSTGAAELVKLAASQIEHRDCQRGCKFYNDRRGALYCPHLAPRDNGEIACYGWLEEEAGVNHHENHR